MKLLVQFWLCFFITSFAVAQGPCNNATSVTYEGYQYDLVEIGNQCWFSENLRNELYANGDVIPANLNDEEWDGATEGAMTIYGEGTSTVYSGSSDEIENLDTYGRLYNWYAVNDVRSLCPSGWSLPLLTDLEELVNHLGGGSTALELLTGNSSSSGFDGLFGGRRTALGSFYYEGTEGSFWSATPNIDANNDGLNLILCSNCEEPFWDSTSKKVGYSVRCIKSEGTVLELGCTDPEATNYDPTATADDGSCTYPPGPCNNATSITYQGYEYDIVEIGDQCWFAENLRYLPEVVPVSVGSEDDGAPHAYVYNWDDNDVEGAKNTAEYGTHGALYNFQAVLEWELCPANWSVPALEDFNALRDFLGGENVAGGKLKETGTIEDGTGSWYSPNTGATDDYGFSAKASGSRSANSLGQGENWGNIGAHLWLWSTEIYPDSTAAWGVNMEYNNTIANDDASWLHQGWSVRCLLYDDVVLQPGCTIEEACNFNPDASEDDGSCLFIGESCDDEDETTSNDMVQDDCICAGEVIEGCTYSVACNYDPLATLFDDSCVYPGDECDDNNDLTTNDAYSENCECLGDPIEVILGCIYDTACNFNPEANQDDMSCLFPGDSCDDEDVTTGNDTYTEDCECVGEPLIGGCTYESACNFNPDAQFDDSSCIFIGDSCDDGDSETENDVMNMDCDCVGTPITSVSEAGLVSMTVYPNPVSDLLTIELGTQQGTLVRVQIFDAQGKLVFDERRVDRILLDVSAYTSGVYTIQAGQGADLKQVQFIVE